METLETFQQYRLRMIDERQEYIKRNREGRPFGVEADAAFGRVLKKRYQRIVLKWAGAPEVENG